jgi:hypothetical protein
MGLAVDLLELLCESVGRQLTHRGTKIDRVGHTLRKPLLVPPDLLFCSPYVEPIHIHERHEHDDILGTVRHCSRRMSLNEVVVETRSRGVYVFEFRRQQRLENHSSLRKNESVSQSSLVAVYRTYRKATPVHLDDYDYDYSK